MLSRKVTHFALKQGYYRPSSLKRNSVKSKLIANTPHVVPLMPKDKISYENVVILCASCDGPCMEDYISCRVCTKTYHYQCLYKSDDVNNQTYLLPSLRKKDTTCSECKDLTRLLTEDEIKYLLWTFQKMDLDKDGFITLKDFLVFRSSRTISDDFNLFTFDDTDLKRVHFSIMDVKQKGQIAWTDFERFYNCKLIAAKNKTQLTKYLSEKELLFAKRLFLKDPCVKLDNKRNLTITKEHFDQVLYELIVTIKKKYGGQFIDSVLHENENIDETLEKLSVITWEEYLRQISVSILLNRSDYDIKNVQTYLVSLLRYFPDTTVHSSHTDSSGHVPTTSMISMPLDLAVIQSFRQHRKILQKLDRQGELEKNQSKTSTNWFLIEDVEDKYIRELPKLKWNARDGRQTISEPWSVVKEIEHIRNEPILITTNSI